MQNLELLEEQIKHTCSNLTTQEYTDLLNSILIFFRPKCRYTKGVNEGKITGEFKVHGVDWEDFRFEGIPTKKCKNCLIVYKV